MAATTSLNRTSPMRDRLLDAGFASLVAVLLGIPFIGLTTADVGGRLVVQTRWDWLFIAAALVFPGRLAVRWLFERKKASSTRPGTPGVASLRSGGEWTKTAGAFAIGAALVLPF